MSKRHHVDHHGNERHMHGWKRAPHDPRDLVLSETPKSGITAMPRTLSLRAKMPGVRDQANLGSCTANGGVVMAEYVLWKETGTMPVHFSRLDLYACTRELEGTPLTEDSGCNVRDVCKALRKFGVCTEATWPYVISKFSQMPPRVAMIEALQHRATSYHLVRSLHAIKASIVDGYPMIFGFDCFQSLMSNATAVTGVVPMPQGNEPEIGGHCVTCVGYDDDRQLLEFQNSWGTGWGDHGFGWLPYAYFTQQLAADFVTLRRETIPNQ